MKKTILICTTLTIIFLACMSSTSSESTITERTISSFTPLEVGKTYKALIAGSFSGESTIIVLEAPKGNWVKVEIQQKKTSLRRYLNMNNLTTISINE